jgi:ribosomal-protein-alanine acetyltransferase
MTATLDDASIKDLGRLYEIEKECFDEEAFSRRQIASLLTDYNSVSLVVKENGKIVGFIIGIIHFDKHVASGHILTIDTARAHRRRGVAQMLLSEIEKIFASKGVKECLLEVREDNAAALNLYRKLGYDKIGKLKNYYGKADGVYLRKILT